MKSFVHLKFVTMLAATSVAACEGEPPRVPQHPGPLVAPEEVEEAPAADAAMPSAPSGALPCPCTSAPVASVASVADAGGDAALAVAEPPPVTTGNIAGTVSTVPANNARNAVVYLEDVPGEAKKGRSVTIDNHMMTFSPYIATTSVGGKVTFSNTDPFPHNVFSPDNGGFNMGLIPQHSARARTFNTAGVYALLCNIHPGMIGYVVVSPSPFYTTANASGKFTLRDVPVGTYRVTAWAPGDAPTTQAITVKDAETTIRIELKRK